MKILVLLSFGEAVKFCELFNNFVRVFFDCQALHSASMPGILTMDVHAADTSHILTGGNDRCATVFNKDTEQVVAVLKGHTKKVTKALYHPEEVNSALRLSVLNISQD